MSSISFCYFLVYTKHIRKVFIIGAITTVFSLFNGHYKRRTPLFNVQDSLCRSKSGQSLIKNVQKGDKEKANVPINGHILIHEMDIFEIFSATARKPLFLLEF